MEPDGTEPAAAEPLQTEWPLGKATVHLAPPRSLAERWAVRLAWDDARGRQELQALVLFGALALCESRIREFVTRRTGIRYSGDVRAFGAAALDYLLGLPEPGTMAELTAAADTAVAMCIRSTVTQEKVQAAVDFSGPPSEPSRLSSTTSSSSGGWNPAGSDPSTPMPPPK